ncbi:MAG: ParA family protein [Saprospiraceae bacterium]|nr:ParA family protein [Saprospiraceae bacterium]
MPAMIISVAHRKGGIGKTSITLHLATALATKKGYKVAVLDTDSQQSAFKYREFESRNYNGQEPPYVVERVLPKHLFDEIRYLREKYDVIFIDVPRLTEDKDDSQLSTALTYCDGVLIPIVAGELEGLSSIEFVKLIQGIEKYKKEKDFSFIYYGFLNKKNQRKENATAVKFMKKLGVPMFQSSLSDVKVLSKPYTYESVMESKEGRVRFAPFFKEFLTKYELDHG